MRRIIKNPKKFILIVIGIVVLIVANMFLLRGESEVFIQSSEGDRGELQVIVNRDDIVEITDVTFDQENYLYDITLKPLKKGAVVLTFESPDWELLTETYVEINVLSMGFIIQNNSINTLNITKPVRFEFICMLFLLIIYFIYKLRKTSRVNRYSYRIMYYHGAIVILLISLVLWLVNILFKDNYMNRLLYFVMYDIVNITRNFILMVNPVMIIVAVCLIFSNIVLIIKEGRQLSNMLGILLGLFLVAIPVIDHYFPYLYRYAYYLFGVRGMDLLYYIEIMTFSILAYFECMMIGAFIGTLKAHHYVPKLNKDYMIILGCGIRADGTLTPLLKGRADRAIWFDKKQRDKTDKALYFVGSGGQGEDEVISEAEAIKRYLMENGIEEERILKEDKSTSTYENMKLSKRVINRDIKSRDDLSEEEVNIAFSTAGYHVFRSGHDAELLGMKVEGIGCRTKWYFYINALIREFVADVMAEKKKHLRNIIIIIAGLAVLMTVCFMYNLI